MPTCMSFYDGIMLALAYQHLHSYQKLHLKRRRTETLHGVVAKRNIVSLNSMFLHIYIIPTVLQTSPGTVSTK